MSTQIKKQEQLTGTDKVDQSELIETLGLKPLDFVKTPKGAIALVTETNNGGKEASISFIGGGNPTYEKNAWWKAGEGLIKIDSLPWLIARATAHPFGRGLEDAKNVFGA